MKTQIHKLEVIVIDDENFGIKDAITTLEDASRYFFINVVSGETVETDWNDDHILNQSNISGKEKIKWFNEAKKKPK